MSENVIVLEFNELSSVLLSKFISAGYLPNFKKMRDESIECLTDAEEPQEHLEPWIQWVTVHTGLSFGEHGVFHLGDGPKLKAPRVWDIVSDAGRPVWVCGSMNAAVASERINGYVLPDPWAMGVTSKPDGLFEPYLTLVRKFVQEHSTGKPNVSHADYLRFARFMIANGLSAKTVGKAIQQLAGEFRERSQWRRAAILDRLQWDLFCNFYRASRPALATFFINSTAHYQHFFWRDMEPNIFLVKPENSGKMYADAIPFGYQKMDELIGEAFLLAGPETSIVLCTALSQQPMLTFEGAGGKQIFRHRDHKALLAFAGITCEVDYAPIMSQQFHLTFKTQADAEDARRKILSLKLEDGREVLLARLEKDTPRLLSGCRIESPPPAGARLSSGFSSTSFTFNELFYPLEALRSGMHHPAGVLWIRMPCRTHTLVQRKVSLREIAPTLLRLAGIHEEYAFSLPAMSEVRFAARAAEAA